MKPVIALVTALALSGPAFANDKAAICNAVGTKLKEQNELLRSAGKAVAIAKLYAGPDAQEALEVASRDTLKAIRLLSELGREITPKCQR